MPKTAEEKLQRLRDRYWQDKDEAAQLREKAEPSARVILQSGREATCEKCRFIGWCRENVWSGELLPCQPQDQEAVYAARETADYVQSYHGPTNYHLPRRTTGMGIERPLNRE
jgi:hypothetical protein